MFIPNGKRAKAKRERRSKNRKRVAAALDGIMNCKSGLDHVLDQYDKIKGSAARIGLCHDIAVAIIDELAKRGQAAGWAWCRGSVEGGTDHSWVESGGWCIDMGDDDVLRVWDASAPPFKIDGNVVRKDSSETLAWAQAREAELAAKGSGRIVA